MLETLLAGGSTTEEPASVDFRSQFLRRPMFLGEMIDMTPSVYNQLVASRPHSVGGRIKKWKTQACDPDPDLPDPKTSPYQIVLEERIPAFQTNFGSLDVIVATSLQFPGFPFYERFYYARDIGWIKWELYRVVGPTPVPRLDLESWFDDVIPECPGRTPAGCIPSDDVSGYSVALFESLACVNADVPECDDDLDNDQDGKVDLSDAHCSSATDDQEAGGGGGGGCGLGFELVLVLLAIGGVGRRRRTRPTFLGERGQRGRAHRSS
jgi:hypothetical protein